MQLRERKKNKQTKQHKKILETDCLFDDSVKPADRVQLWFGLDLV